MGFSTKLSDGPRRIGNGPTVGGGSLGRLSVGRGSLPRCDTLDKLKGRHGASQLPLQLLRLGLGPGGGNRAAAVSVFHRFARSSVLASLDSVLVSWLCGGSRHAHSLTVNPQSPLTAAVIPLDRQITVLAV